jgi:hypothetical protein
MKKSLPVLLLLISASFISCRKNTASEQYIPDNNAITPDLTVKITASVAGFVVDETNQPIAFAQVIAGSSQTQTDEYGYFKISNASLSEAAGFVKVVRNGYFSGYRTFTANEGKETFIRIQLLSKSNSGVINATSGGAVTTTDGARVQLPANAVVMAGQDSAYTGNVNVAVRWIDPTDNFQLSAPGDARGLDTKGHLAYTKSSGTIAVELTSDAGQLLQIASAKKATITIPIASALIASFPATISLWSFNETNGFWKEESTATKSGNTYVGEVGHFSYWQGATGIALVNFTTQVVDAALQPLANVPVMITQANLPQHAGYGKFAYTDANGYVYGPVLANSSLILDVLTTCGITAYAHPFSTATTDIDLGVISGNLGQSLVTIMGTVKNCSNAAVTDGYVQTYDNGYYNRFPIVNGSFSYTGLACTNTSANYVVVDNTSNQQNAPQTVTLIPGTNDLGQLTACGVSTLTSLSYTINGVTTTLTEPSSRQEGLYLAPQSTAWSIVIGYAPGGAQDASFQFDGGLGTGSGHKVTEFFSPGFTSGRAVAPVPLTVNITEYGNNGGFITGNFNGLMLDFVSNAIYNVSCDFRVRRRN